MEHIEVRLLGPMFVRRANGTVVLPTEWRTTKTVDLLRLLVLEAGQPVAIHSLIDKLWPNVDDERGRASLRTAASQLRKVLRTDGLERRAGSLVLHDVWVDTQAYSASLAEVEAARRVGAHAQTVALAQVSESLYVDDIEVPDTSGDWLYEAREHFRGRRCRVLLDAAHAAASLNWMRDSLDLARQAAELDPCEEASRALMRALAGVGEVEKALDVFERTRLDLYERLGVDPSAQTRALHVQLLTGTRARPSNGGLVGHEKAVEEMAAAVGRMLRSGSGTGIVWVCGEPGSGRDSVVQAACRQLGVSVHNMNHEASWIHGRHLDPGSAWDIPATDVLVMPGADTVPKHALGMLCTLAHRHGGVLVVPVRTHLQGVEATTLPDPSVPTELVKVGALSQVAFVELAGVVLQGEPTGRLARRLRSESGALSGVACRIARRWLNEGRIVWTGEGLDLCAAGETGGLFMSGPLRRQLRLLSPLAADLMNVVAVASAGIVAADIASVMEEIHDSPDIQPELDLLVDAGLLTVTTAGYRLRQSHARRELLGWMRPAVRRRMHGLFAELVPMGVALRVGHLVSSGQPQLACDLGFTALDRAHEQGDIALSEELLDALLELPRTPRAQSEILELESCLRGALNAEGQPAPELNVPSGARTPRFGTIAATLMGPRDLLHGPGWQP